MTTNEAGQLGAMKRRQIEREPILQRAVQMRAEMGMKPHPALRPVLILTQADRL